MQILANAEKLNDSSGSSLLQSLARENENLGQI